MSERRVQRIPTDRVEIAQLREVAERNLADAAIPELSTDTRAGLSYDAARSAANMALRASSHRLRGMRSHETTFDGLAAIGSPLDGYVDYFQQRRIRRNALTYQTAGETTVAEAGEALAQARELLATIDKWLTAHFRELVE